VVLVSVCRIDDMTAGMVWLVSHGDEDMKRWQEYRQIERWIEEGDSSKPETAERVPVHLQLAVTKEGAGQLLGGKSVDWVEKHVLPHVNTVKPSRSVLIPTSELERWINDNASRAF
jgi:hypothetical protein